MGMFLAFLQWAYKAALEHEAVIGLLGLAFIITMPPRLPVPFCNAAPLEWLWEWCHNGLKAFVSFRQPTGSEVPPASPAPPADPLPLPPVQHPPVPPAPVPAPVAPPVQPSNPVMAAIHDAALRPNKE